MACGPWLCFNLIKRINSTVRLTGGSPLSVDQSTELVDHVGFLLIKIIPKILLNDLNFKNQYLLNCNSDRKTLYIKIDQKNITNTDTLSVYQPHPSNTPNIEPSPSGPFVR